MSDERARTRAVNGGDRAARSGADISEDRSRIAATKEPGARSRSRSVLARRGGRARANTDREAQQDSRRKKVVDEGKDEPDARKTEGKPKQPPKPWKLKEHPDAPGEWYYCNEVTGVTCWELPEEDDGDSYEEVDVGVKPPTPPRPWKLREHPDAPGEWYYLNEETGVTTWELPRDAR